LRWERGRRPHTSFVGAADVVRRNADAPRRAAKSFILAGTIRKDDLERKKERIEDFVS
jgi:hypothetical protein